MPEKCVVYRLGRVLYEEAWELQGRLASQIASGIHPPTLLLLEHPHTFTFGRRGHPENLLWDPEELSRRKVTVLWVDRGGDVTYHGPGQLVGYPLLPLASKDWSPLPFQDTESQYGLFAGTIGETRKNDGSISKDPWNAAPRLEQVDYIGYLRRLEESVIYALRLLGVTGVRMKGMTGVWVKSETLPSLSSYRTGNYCSIAKIAAIGVKVDAQGVSRHGFALNVNPDMQYWEGIIGCGLKDYPVTGLNDLPQCHPTMTQVMDAIVVAFGEVFGCEMVELHQEAERFED
jgi:lipoate-protein ligase B